MKRFKVFTAVAALALILTACNATETALPETSTLTENPPQLATEAPTEKSVKDIEPFIIQDFTLTQLDGTETNLYAYEGKDQLILINFWATWCKYCVQEMPLLDALDQRDDVTVLAISVGEKKDTVQEYIDSNGYAFNVLLDADAKLATKFGVTGFPTTLFIGPDFEFYYQFPGMLEENMLQSILEAIDALMVERGHK